VKKNAGPIKATMILGRCGCPHPFQDTKYGLGIRQHTISGKPGKPNPYRCTVCEREKDSIVQKDI